MLCQFFTFSRCLGQPEVMAQYEEVLPGLADRIMAEAEESQTAHRQAAEMTVIRNDARQSMFGMAWTNCRFWF